MAEALCRTAVRTPGIIRGLAGFSPMNISRIPSVCSQRLPSQSHEQYWPAVRLKGTKSSDVSKEHDPVESTAPDFLSLAKTFPKTYQRPAEKVAVELASVGLHVDPATGHVFPVAGNKKPAKSTKKTSGISAANLLSFLATKRKSELRESDILPLLPQLIKLKHVYNPEAKKLLSSEQAHMELSPLVTDAKPDLSEKTKQAKSTKSPSIKRKSDRNISPRPSLNPGESKTTSKMSASKAEPTDLKENEVKESKAGKKTKTVIKLKENTNMTEGSSTATELKDNMESKSINPQESIESSSIHGKAKTSLVKRKSSPTRQVKTIPPKDDKRSALEAKDPSPKDLNLSLEETKESPVSKEASSKSHIDRVPKVGADALQEHDKAQSKLDTAQPKISEVKSQPKIAFPQQILSHLAATRDMGQSNLTVNKVDPSNLETKKADNFIKSTQIEEAQSKPETTHVEQFDLTVKEAGQSNKTTSIVGQPDLATKEIDQLHQVKEIKHHDTITASNQESTYSPAKSNPVPVEVKSASDPAVDSNTHGEQQDRRKDAEDLDQSVKIKTAYPQGVKEQIVYEQNTAETKKGGLINSVKNMFKRLF